ncbi:uncharacterized protein LOC107047799 [Diachasma alloeum]|uniref:uncharacterized protein LOC107047799 n=1 Tax=Diachasma alloeum TaxID=454923 RepID=UPI0007383874|nr:uncharacterized protein LOC107047799 [Diachasma alloeum]
MMNKDNNGILLSQTTELPPKRQKLDISGSSSLKPQDNCKSALSSNPQDSEAITQQGRMGFRSSCNALQEKNDDDNSIQEWHLTKKMGKDLPFDSSDSVNDANTDECGNDFDELFEEEPPQGRRIIVGDHETLSSNSNFFEIDWTKYYTVIAPGMFVCNACSHITSSCTMMQAHIWVAHCVGSFKCLLCPAQVLSHRYYVKRHMKIMHSNASS